MGGLSDCEIMSTPQPALDFRICPCAIALTALTGMWLPRSASGPTFWFVPGTAAWCSPAPAPATLLVTADVPQPHAQPLPWHGLGGGMSCDLALWDGGPAWPLCPVQTAGLLRPHLRAGKEPGPGLHGVQPLRVLCRSTGKSWQPPCGTAAQRQAQMGPGGWARAPCAAGNDRENGDLDQTLFTLRTAGDQLCAWENRFKAATVFSAAKAPSWEIFSYRYRNILKGLSKYSA